MKSNVCHLDVGLQSGLAIIIELIHLIDVGVLLANESLRSRVIENVTDDVWILDGRKRQR